MGRLAHDGMKTAPPRWVRHESSWFFVLVVAAIEVNPGLVFPIFRSVKLAQYGLTTDRRYAAGRSRSGAAGSGTAF